MRSLAHAYREPSLPARNGFFCYIAAMDPRASVRKCACLVLTAAGKRWEGRWCDHCQQKAARELMTRSDWEFQSMRPGTVACMVGLSFKDEALHQFAGDWGHAAFEAFVKRVEDRVAGVKCFGVPEFGTKGTRRLHVHSVFYGVSELLCRPWTVMDKGKVWEMTRFREIVRECWPHGWEDTQVCRSAAGARYCMKYVGKNRLDRVLELREWHSRCVDAEARGWSEPQRPERLYWTHWPRGRQGGLGRAFALDLAEQARRDPATFVRADLPRWLQGAGGRRVAIPRYARRVAWRPLGLDSDAAKAVRAARDPEAVEMAWRISQAGGVKQLRRSGQYFDDDVSSVACAKARKARELGRW